MRKLDDTHEHARYPTPCHWRKGKYWAELPCSWPGPCTSWKVDSKTGEMEWATMGVVSLGTPTFAEFAAAFKAATGITIPPQEESQ